MAAAAVPPPGVPPEYPPPIRGNAKDYYQQSGQENNAGNHTPSLPRPDFIPPPAYYHNPTHCRRIYPNPAHCRPVCGIVTPAMA